MGTRSSALGSRGCDPRQACSQAPAVRSQEAGRVVREAAGLAPRQQLRRRGEEPERRRSGAFMCFVGHGAFGILTKQGWLPYFALLGGRRTDNAGFRPLAAPHDPSFGPLGPDDAGTQAERKARFSGGAPGRSRTCGPRLRRRLTCALALAREKHHLAHAFRAVCALRASKRPQASGVLAVEELPRGAFRQARRASRRRERSRHGELDFLSSISPPTGASPDGARQGLSSRS